jgi:Zn-dependent protease
LILIALVLSLGGALYLDEQPPTGLMFAFVIAAWILSVAVHEFGHAWIAYLGGDTSVQARGYLTLDPLKYTDLQTSLVFPLLALALGGIGFPGGAVFLQPNLMRNRLWRSLASLAGPFGTLLVLMTIGILTSLLGRAGRADDALVQALSLLAYLQASALVLNLLPIPGLDGFGVLRPFLPAPVLRLVLPLSGIFMMAMFALILLVPGFSARLFGVAGLLTDAMGISRTAIAAGFDGFRFWR